MNYLHSPQIIKGVFCNVLVASCKFFGTFSDDFPQHGKAWKSMESMGTSLCLQIGYIQRILIAYCQPVIL